MRFMSVTGVDNGGTLNADGQTQNQSGAYSVFRIYNGER